MNGVVFQTSAMMITAKELKRPPNQSISSEISGRLLTNPVSGAKANCQAKAAIMVALLFRTLDAFRVFDSIFIMTAGANGTESVSFLAYRQTIARLEIGLGSAVSVLLFIAVVLIAFSFIKAFKVDLSQARGE